MKVHTLLRVLNALDYIFIENSTDKREHISKKDSFLKIQKYFDKTVVKVFCRENRAIVTYK